jgi:hypothetical protein
VLGIPLFSLVGGISLVGFVGAIVILALDQGSGVSIAKNPGKLEMAIAIYALGFAIYFASKAIRRRQGIDLELAYRELPPE